MESLQLIDFRSWLDNCRGFRRFVVRRCGNVKRFYGRYGWSAPIQPGLHRQFFVNERSNVGCN